MRRRRPWRSETRRFLSRLPELPSLRYDDGQSLASEATQLWLAGLSQGTVGAVALAAVPPSQEDSHTAAAVAEAMDILDSQGPVEALRRLESALGPSATGNARLRCQELRILCGHGASKAAAALGRALRLDMERDRLVELKPDLAAGVLAAIVSIVAAVNQPSVLGGISLNSKDSTVNINANKALIQHSGQGILLNSSVNVTDADNPMDS